MMRQTSLAALAVLALGLVGVPELAGTGFASAQEAGVTTEEQLDPALESQVRALAAKLRCPTCRALSVLDSPSGMAQEMRGLIREQLRSGMTPADVEAYFVERYGEWILLEPKAEGFNWTVWLLPVLLLVGGLAFVFLTARRWVRQGQAAGAVIAEGGHERET